MEVEGPARRGPVRRVAEAAWRLDDALQGRLGRPYNALLGFGLTYDIIRSAHELPEALRSVHRFALALFLMTVRAALLLHQVGALTHRFERRDRFNAERLRSSAPDPAPPDREEPAHEPDQPSDHPRDHS